MNKKVLITGSLAFDLIMDFPGKFTEHIDPSKLHIMNISFLVDSFKRARGGNSGNIAYTLSLLGMKTGIISSAGEDFEDYGLFLEKNKISIEDIEIIEGETTATATIMTDKSDNQISAFYPGAMRRNTELNIKYAKFKPDFVVITPDVPEAMVRFARQCQDLKIPYLFDPGMQLPRLSDAQIIAGITGAEILIANDYEMGIIDTRIKGQVSNLKKKVKIIITTLGEKGSVIEHNGDKINIGPGKPREVSDPTGAGDAYRAGFLAGYLRGFDLKICGQMGSISACYAIEKYGTTNHRFSVGEFKRRYQENFGEILSLGSQA